MWNSSHLHLGLAEAVGGKHCTPLQPQWWRSHLLRCPVESWKRGFRSVCLGGVLAFFISSVKYEGESSSQQSSARASWSNLPHKCSPWGKTYASFTLSVLLVPLNRTEQGSLLDPVAPDPIDSHYHQLLNAWRWEYSDWSFYFQSRGSHVMHMSIILCGFSPAGR